MSKETFKRRAARETEQKEANMRRWRSEYEMLHRSSRHWAEIKILSYLYTHGNTREDDLTAYASRTLNKSANNVRKILDRMAKEDKIKRIVHKKLEPQVVYFAEGDIISLDFDLWTLAGIDRDGNIERYRRALKNELRKNRENR
jgi:hypothetical protein